MALPFRVGPESSQRPAEADPFLEFESERPGRRVSSHPFFKDQLLRPEPAPEPDLSRVQAQAQALPPLPPIVQTSKPLISPVVGFAVGVAGIAAAAVAYDQLAQFVAKKNAEAPPAAVIATVPTTEGDKATASSGSRRSRATGAAPGGTRGAGAGNSRAAQPRPASASARPAAGRAAPGAGSAAANSAAVTFDSPVSCQVYAGGQLRGLSTDRGLTLPAGTRAVTLVNTQLEYRQTLPIAVQAGQPVRLSVPLPTGSLSINALPWAEVWVGGASVGTTPLANLSLPIGSHEVVWRHPTLGERRQTVVVKAQTPARIGVDFHR